MPILLDRGAIYLEKGMTDQAYVDYCQVLDKDKVNAEAPVDARLHLYLAARL